MGTHAIRITVHTLVVAVLFAFVDPAFAASTVFKEQLSPDQIRAASKAAKQRIPRPPAGGGMACRERQNERHADDPPPFSAAGLVIQATCYEKAGLFGTAIGSWRQILQSFPKAPEAKEAVRAFARLNEKVGEYDKAVAAYEFYADHYAHDAGDPATDEWIRATCMRRQMGDAREAERDLASLRTAVPGRTFDSDTLCDHVRPIVPPAP
jgi:hypothetical protein